MGASSDSPDALSDVLRSIRLNGCIFFEVAATTRWVAEAPSAASVADIVRPGSQHVLEFHACIAGSCYGGLLGEPLIRLEPGDVIVFPKGHAHVMASDPEIRADGPISFDELRGARLPVPARFGDSKEDETRLVCGFIGCDSRPFNPLIDALPPVFVASSAPDESDRLASLAQLAMTEARRGAVGSECVLERLSELIFIESVRHYMTTTAPRGGGWFAGLRDPQIGATLARIHANPREPFTLESLARVAGMSRSTFVERFTSLVEIPPMQYVAQWRMQVAASHLGRGDLSLGAIASLVGFESESAFSRAFKRIVGQPPGEFRRTQRAPIRLSS